MSSSLNLRIIKVYLAAGVVLLSMMLTATALPTERSITVGPQSPDPALRSVAAKPPAFGSSAAVSVPAVNPGSPVRVAALNPNSPVRVPALNPNSPVRVPALNPNSPVRVPAYNPSANP